MVRQTPRSDRGPVHFGVHVPETVAGCWLGSDMTAVKWDMVLAIDLRRLLLRPVVPSSQYRALGDECEASLGWR